MKFYGQSVITGGGSVDPIDKIIFDRYFSRRTNGFFIEAGANDGLFLTSCKVFEDLGWKGLNFEPARELFVKLERNRPDCINLNIALLDEEKMIEFEAIDFDNGGWCRIADEHRHQHLDQLFNIQVAEKYLVKTNTYANVIKEQGINVVDLFVLDVEGFEIEVIQGMGDDVTKKPKVLCIEHTHVGLPALAESLKLEYYLDWNDGLNAIFVRKDVSLGDL